MWLLWGSMNKAAGENGLSIATVSQKIASLESALGYPIFERTTRRTMLTPAGQNLVARIEPSVHAFKRSLPDFGAAASDGRTKITCAVSNSLTVPVLEAAANFLQGHPEIDFEIIDNQYYFRDRLLPIDISVFANLAHHERDENQILGVEPSYFLASPKLIDEAGPFETPADLARVRLLMCSNWTCSSPFYQHAVPAASRSGLGSSGANGGKRNRGREARARPSRLGGSFHSLLSRNLASCGLRLEAPPIANRGILLQVICRLFR